MLAGLTVGLAGCANTRLAATVTRFHQWPAASQGASYAIAPSPASVPAPAPAQTPNGALIGSAQAGQPQAIASEQALAAPVTVALPPLEYQTYAAYLEQALQAKGLAPANRPEQARMQVSFAVFAQQGVVQERVLTMRPMLWLGYGGFGWRSGFGVNAFYDDYDHDLFGWHERMVTRPVQSYRLHVTVVDRGQSSTGTKGLAARLPATAPTVLEAQAQYTGRPVPLAVVMPYLVRAVFEDFPGVSGQTKQVVFDTQTGERQ
ncbi:MAG: DUF4136 domain-containing protein [Brachymonas sp.]|nr:DUF4136 domain-containing protein [Brachymonas sp.]